MRQLKNYFILILALLMPLGMLWYLNNDNHDSISELMINVTKSCGDDATLIANATGGTGTLTSLWDCGTFGSGADPYNFNVGNAPTTITCDLTTTDTNGCTTTDQIIIEVECCNIIADCRIFKICNGAFQPLNQCFDSPCLADCTSYRIWASFNLSGGTAPYSFSWTLNGSPTGVTTPFFDPTSPGIYEVTITDANGCTTTLEYTITDGCSPCTDPVVTISGNCTAGYTSNISGVCPSPSYQWLLNGTAITTATSSTYLPPSGASGTLTLQVLCANGCGDTSNGLFINCSCTNPTVQLSGDCLVGLTANVIGLCPSPIYQWTFGGTPIGTGAFLSPTVIQANGNGVYTFSVTCSNGCGANSVINVTSCPTNCVDPIVQAQGDCLTGLTGNVIGLCPSPTYTWVGGTTVVSTNLNVPASIIQANGNGAYTLTVNCANGCGDDNTIFVSNCTAQCDCQVSFVLDPVDCDIDYNLTGTTCGSWTIQRAAGPGIWTTVLTGFGTAGTYLPTQNGTYRIVVSSSVSGCPSVISPEVAVGCISNCDCNVSIVANSTECEVSATVTGTGCNNYQLLIRELTNDCFGCNSSIFGPVLNPSGTYTIDVTTNAFCGGIDNFYNAVLVPTGSCTPVSTSCVEINGCECEECAYKIEANESTIFCVFAEAIQCTGGSITQCNDIYSVQYWVAIDLISDCEHSGVDTLNNVKTYLLAENSFRIAISYLRVLITGTIDLLTASGTSNTLIIPPSVSDCSQLASWLNIVAPGVLWYCNGVNLEHCVSGNNSIGLDYNENNGNARIFRNNCSHGDECQYDVTCGDVLVRYNYSVGNNIDVTFIGGGGDLEVGINQVLINQCNNGTMSLALQTTQTCSCE